MSDEIALDLIVPSPHNPRKTFEEGPLKELAASIAAKGVLEPVLLRPHRPWIVHAESELGPFYLRLRAGKGKGSPYIIKDDADADCAKKNAADGRFEIVAGERRVRAARLAGLKTVPAIVREMSDRDALEIAVVENEQRADVAPLERAEGYHALMANHGATVDEIAGKVGKAPSTIRALLKLRHLPEAARQALLGGQISMSVAQLIARIPGAAPREKCAAEVLEGRQLHYGSKEREPYSYRDVKGHIEREYTVELKGAPFNRKALDLVPAAGSCEACPKRVGNLQKLEPDEYAGIRADVCTDTACYRSKVEAWQAKVAAEASARGQKVLPAKECEKLFPYEDRLAYDAGYIDLKEQCYQDAAKKTPRSYKQLLDGHIQDSDVVVAFDKCGEAHRLVSKETALPILKKEHGLFNNASANGNGRHEPDKYELERRRKEKVDAELCRRMQAKVVAQVEAELAGYASRSVDLIRVLTVGLLDEVWAEVLSKLIARRDLKPEDESKGRHMGRLGALHGLVQRSQSHECLAILAEALVVRNIRNPYHERDTKDALWDALGIDTAAERKAVEQELREKERAKVKGKKAPPPELAGTETARRPRKKVAQ